MAEYDGSIRIGVKVDTAEAENDLQDLGGKVKDNFNASGFSDGMKNAISTTAKLGAVAVGAASTATAALAKSALDSYASYEQLTGGVETLFKDSSSTVMQYADNAYKTAGLSANQYMEAVTGFSASLLQSLGGDTAKAADVADMALIDMSDNANKMGSSMESIQNAYQGFAKQNYTMLDNLKLGYGGTKEEMQRLLTDAERLSGVHYDLSSFSDIAQAIHVVQTEMGITGTTAKEASETIEGSVGSVKAAWENLVTGLGNEDADLSGLMDNLVSSLEAALGNIMPRLEQVMVGIGAMVTGLAPVIGEKVPSLIAEVLPSLIDAGIKLLEGLVSGVKEALPQLLDALMDIITTAGEAVVGLIPDVIASLPDIIAGIVDFLTQNLQQLIDLGIDMLKAVADGLVQAIPDMVERLPGIINSIVQFIADNIPKIAEGALDIIQGLANGLIQAAPQLVTAIPSIIASLLHSLAEAYPKLIQAGFDLLQKLLDGILSAVPEVIQKLPEVAVSVLGAFADMFGGAVDIGANVVRGLWEGIKSMLSWLVDKVRGFVTTIIDTAKEVLGIHSPSRVFAGIGENTVEGFNQGVRRTESSAYSAMDSTFSANKAVSALSNAAQPQLYGLQGSAILKSVAAPSITADDLFQAFQSANRDEGSVMDVNVNFTGTMAQFARMLNPYIQVETRRVGTSLVV